MSEETRAAELQRYLQNEDREALITLFHDLHPADAARQLADLSPQEIARYIEIVGPSEALTAFEFVPFEMQKETLQHLTRDTLVQIITLMSPDDRADLVEEMDEQFRERLLSRLIQAEKQNILKLITYPEDSAGAYMTTDYALLRSETTVRAALDQLRFQALKKETIYYVYVVDQVRRLVGFVSLRDLIMASPEKIVGEIMYKKVISVRVDKDIEDVVKEMTRYDFLAIPVVDADERLVGIITYDDIFDVINEEATEDMYLLANLDTDDKISSPLSRSVKLRVPWLLVNLCTALLSAFTVSFFSETIARFVVLASLMPIVAGVGGNAGTQALTVVVRALALGEMKLRGNWKLLLKQAGVGLFCGVICGMVMAIIAYVWHRNIWLSFIIWMAMIANLIIAGLVGSFVPIVLRRFRLDPALGSSIFVTMSTDVAGFFTFLGLASLLIQFLLEKGY